MNLSEFIEDALAEEHEFLMGAVHDLTSQELAWRAGPEANPINWILWHMFRVEDMWVQFFIQNRLEIWERDGWHQKFDLPTRDNGFDHTLEQVTNFPTLDLQEILQYGEAVRTGTLEYLRTLGPQDYDTKPRERRPDMSVGIVLRRILGEFCQHQGHISYLKGLVRSRTT